MEIIFLVLCLCGVVNSGSVPFSDCGSEYKLNQIEVQNCKYLPCPVWMNDYTAFNVSLTAPFYSKHLNQEIIIKTKGINTRDLGTSPSTCEGSRPCPINTGDASFSTKLWTPDIAPFPSTLQWILTNENGKRLMCFILNIVLCDDNYPDTACHQ